MDLHWPEMEKSWVPKWEQAQAEKSHAPGTSDANVKTGPNRPFFFFDKHAESCSHAHTGTSSQTKGPAFSVPLALLKSPAILSPWNRFAVPTRR